jgi:hypothetical protein
VNKTKINIATISPVKYTDYVICLIGENFSEKFLSSWTKSIIKLTQNNEKFIYTNFYSPIVSHTRNEIIKRFPGQESDINNAMPFGGELEAKKIIFIDDDMVWEFEDLQKILKSEKNIVSGFYKMNWGDKKNKNFLAATKNEKFMLEKDIKNKTELIEVEAVGFGFISIDFEVFKKIQFPWFEVFHLFDKGKSIVVNKGEDFTFCEKAISAGYKIYADPTIKLGHEKTHVLDFKK